MNPTYQFNRFDLALLIASTLVFGGCVTLMLLGKLNGPLLLLTIGTFGILITRVGKAYRRPRKSEATADREEQR